MQHHIFINLATKQLPEATAFYEAIGFVKSPQFSDEKASGLVLTDVIHLMLLTEEFFQGFLAHKTIANPFKTCEVLNALSVESRSEVDGFLERVIAAGGREFRTAQDHGFMYSRAFEDMDGHVWEIFWMDPTTAQW